MKSVKLVASLLLPFALASALAQHDGGRMNGGGWMGGADGRIRVGCGCGPWLPYW